MRLSIMTAALAMTMMLTASPSAANHRIDRHARIIFNHSLPPLPLCISGWYGRGVGLMAVCTLGQRMQVRFIDGFVLPCNAPHCLDHAPRIETFLLRNGY